MPVSQESIRPLDGAIIDYCCAFFGRTLTLCWQDLPVQQRGSRQVLLNLKDYFLAALTHDFLGCISAIDEVCDAPHWGSRQDGVEFLDALEAALVRQCTESCAVSLLEIQQHLTATSSYNTLAFDPRTIMAFVVAAVLKSKLEPKVGSALCYAFINRLGLSIGVFYKTLVDVLKGYIPDDQNQTASEHALGSSTSNNMHAPPLSARNAGEPAGRSEINGLTGYIQRFYTSNLYTQSNPPYLAALFQHIYAALLCYIRDSCDEVEKKSTILRQVLQELYSLTELENNLFLQPNKIFDRITERLNEPEPYLCRTLNYVSEELSAFNRLHSARYGVARLSLDEQPFEHFVEDDNEFAELELDLQNRPSDLLNLQMVKSVLEQDAFSGAQSTHQQACITNVFQHVERLINQALMNCSAGEVSHFIDRYWRHALSVTGLREGVDSLAWCDAIALLDELCLVQVMAAVDEDMQSIIMERMREIDKHYLSYNDFLEREEYLQGVDVIGSQSSLGVTSRH
ncbi:DUF1631 domain-containing protein [Marinagarivorans cellulosilyticus]|uniref:Uncharacterized protein n=1 Tax=Marinagarivorans cellulosilyticus TaxID=2721545 RepID=A0AAN1WEM3_9GAMM|nr:DUF1631 domain-containing protein [Marinagarivorans cellulosilyticus]BCD96190.1 hypothetical protein MARGE09_P0389 [Marinagarivorans cellulosilyticus]